MTIKRNWNKYNKQLINRGNLGLLVKKEIFSKPRSTSRGRSYNKDFITSIHLLKHVLKLSLRGIQGYTTYIIKDLLDLNDVDIPEFSTINKSSSKVDVIKRNYYKSTLYSYKNIELIVDSTGITITHKGEWLLAKYANNHGDCNKNRDSKAKFVKLHTAIDKDTFVSLSNTITEAIGENTHDTTQYEELINKINSSYKNDITKVLADKGYDSQSNYKITNNIGADFVCPIKKNVKNIALGNMSRHIAKVLRDNDDYKAWSDLTEYNKRVLIESWFSRFKRVMGSKCRSKVINNIKKEIEIKIHILNEYAMREANLDKCFNHSI